MSILVCSVLPEGIVFGADRYLTGTLAEPQRGRYVYQQEGKKVLCWPRRKALVGYVGLGTIGGCDMGDWLYDFIGDHIDFRRPADVAADMRDRLQAELGVRQSPDRLIVEFAAFDVRDGGTVPEFWHITNVHGLEEKTGHYLPASEEFRATEQILGVAFKGRRPSTIRTILRDLAANHNPFWIHQGFNLAVYNTLESALKQGFKILHDANLVPTPNTLVDWEAYVKMWVLTYAAYFDAFEKPGFRYVGGGADVLSIPWPSD